MNYNKEQIKYRQRHKKCRWCKHSKYQVWFHWTDTCYWECKLSEDIIKYDRLKAMFCKYYDIEKGDIELEDENRRR